MKTILAVSLIIAAFLLGVLAAPILPFGSSRETLVLEGYADDASRIRRRTSSGWAVERTDNFRGGQLVTFSRPRILSWSEQVGDLVNSVGR